MSAHRPRPRAPARARPRCTLIDGAARRGGKKGAPARPQAWVGDARRGFARGGGAAGDGDVLAYPPDVRACVALASDPAGVTTAEVVAREAAAPFRAPGIAAPFRALGLVAPPRIVWRVLAEGELGSYRRAIAGEVRRVGPHSPRTLADVLAVGYVLDALTDDALVLVAPGV